MSSEELKKRALKFGKACLMAVGLILYVIYDLTRQLMIQIFVRRNREAIKYSVVALVVVLIIVVRCSHREYVEYIELKSRPTSINALLTNEKSTTDLTKGFDRDVETFMRQWGLVGGTFAIMRNDSLLYAKGYGYANKGSNIKCDAGNVFRVASVSKLLTATAIMKLSEEGRLSLSSRVFGEDGILCDSIFLDLKSKNLKEITIEHLLRHTAGFSSPHGDPPFSTLTIARIMDKELPLKVDDLVEYATHNRLKARPGAYYDYSNLGYIVLGKVVEKITGMSYENYLQEKIFAPIGCYDLTIGESFTKNRRPNEVKYYEVKEAEPVKACDGSGLLTMKSDGGNNISLLGAAGGWVGSSAELLRLVASINGEGSKSDILSKESVKKMTHYDKRYKPIGWAQVTSYEWQRSGSMAGTTALIKRQRNGYTWIFISNSSSWNGYRLANYISSNFTRYISKVKAWPKQDLFAITAESVAAEQEVAAEAEQ